MVVASESRNSCPQCKALGDLCPQCEAKIGQLFCDGLAQLGFVRIDEVDLDEILSTSNDER